MSFANPTPIRLGMTATLDGCRYRVAGRVVMGMEQDGETYYWNEFNLVSDDGESATLVFEETERGGEWRLFTLFEPEFPMSAADAASKRVGDQLNLDGHDVRVTLVDETRVYHIEGAAPGGVEVGDVAHYFNAEAGNRMFVVSWTGDEVEYFRGVTLSAARIAWAFQLQQGALDGLSRAPVGSLLSSVSDTSSSGASSSSGGVVKLAVIVLLFVFAIAAFATIRSRGLRPTLARTPAPVVRLIVGATGNLGGKNYRVQGHALVEIAQVGRRYDRHEYQVLDAEENRALLICSWKPGGDDWFLFTPLHPAEPLTPIQAAVLRLGDSLNLDGYASRIDELFQSQVLQADGEVPPELATGTRAFNFSANTGTFPLLARWNEREINFYRGNALTKEAVEAAFTGKPGK